jgi:hypothetical protein
MEQDSHAHFLPTHWTLIEALKAPEQTVRTAAMAELARRYWPPVYAHLRRSGRTKVPTVRDMYVDGEEPGGFL